MLPQEGGFAIMFQETGIAIQRRRSGARFAWGRGLRNFCVVVPNSRGWDAGLLWLSGACSSPFCCTCRGPGRVWVGALERWFNGLVPSIAPRAPLCVCLPVGASGVNRLWSPACTTGIALDGGQVYGV